MSSGPVPGWYPPRVSGGGADQRPRIRRSVIVGAGVALAIGVGVILGFSPDSGTLALPHAIGALHLDAAKKAELPEAVDERLGDYGTPVSGTYAKKNAPDQVDVIAVKGHIAAEEQTRALTKIEAGLYPFVNNQFDSPERDSSKGYLECSSGLLSTGDVVACAFVDDNGAGAFVILGDDPGGTMSREVFATLKRAADPSGWRLP